MPGLILHSSNSSASSTLLTRMAKTRESMCEADPRNLQSCSAMWIASELSGKRQGITVTNSEGWKAGRSAVDYPAEINTVVLVARMPVVMEPTAEESMATEVDSEEIRQGSKTLAEEIGLKNTTNSMRAQRSLPHAGGRKLQHLLRNENRSKQNYLRRRNQR